MEFDILFLMVSVFLLNPNAVEARASESRTLNVSEPLLKDADQSWFKCEHDSHCKIASGLCAEPVAVNANYENALLSYLLKIGGAKFCPYLTAPRWPYGVECRHKRCLLIWEQKAVKKEKK